MALIETTDSFFAEVTDALRSHSLEQHGVIGLLDDLYQSLSGVKPKFLKSSIVIWDTYEHFVDEELVSKITQFIESEPTLADSIVSHYDTDIIYKQSTVLFVYWMLSRHRAELSRTWPLPDSMLQSLATDLGINLTAV
jgi:hypothetical protein